ncbi:MAG: hypothetical protein ACR2HM_06270 [Acidimicrobiales bacterium]
MKRLLAVVAVLLVAGGCSAMKATPSSNVRPPAPGVPATGADVTGIYRSIHQGVLQLRSDGDYILVVPEGPGPTTGSYTLSAGRLSVYSEACGPETGDYDVVVTGEQLAGKAMLNISAVRDPCEDRRKYLTIGPWVYANS